ncbi:MarR family protease production transcriptional regulator HPr [Neobacillus bataviensis]|uniref:MarR family protease production transcriptional regulator HPr n=2 Tax=Neobacillus bataviensis TaxID=220685 RepID=A0A561CAA3_9BACI|nr:MarR family protease production transcriptional regulator HPr [Neobacillus bataviensis]
MGEIYSMKEALIFSQRVAQLSKALWKVIENDIQRWIKPFNLNINEYHILWISYYLNGSSISEIAELGVMHVSTAFNFSKKLEERGLLQFLKREDDKRNTYTQLTDKGKEIIISLLESYQREDNDLVSASLPLRNLYGKFPELLELKAIIRNINGEKFMDTHEQIFQHLEKDFIEEKVK